jgi:uncharacterized protein (DUF1778 family)
LNEQEADLDDTSVTAFMLDSVTSRAKRVTAVRKAFAPASIRPLTVAQVGRQVRERPERS